MVYGLLVSEIGTMWCPAKQSQESREKVVPPWTRFYFEQGFEPQILLTNRQINNEATSIIYRKIQLKYYIDCHFDLVAFSQNLQISPLNNVQLCRLYFDMGGMDLDVIVIENDVLAFRSLKEALDVFSEALGSLSSLQELEVICMFPFAGSLVERVNNDAPIMVWNSLKKFKGLRSFSFVGKKPSDTERLKTIIEG